MSSWDLFIYLDIGLHLVKNSCRILWRMSIKSNRINTNDVDAAVSYWLFDCMTRVAVRNLHGVNFIHASCDILLLALSIIFAYFKAKIIPIR